MRKYRVSFWVGDDRDELEFYSNHRAGSKANREDALWEIRIRKGKYVYERAEIIAIWLDND